MDSYKQKFKENFLNYFFDDLFLSSLGLLVLEFYLSYFQPLSLVLLSERFIHLYLLDHFFTFIFWDLILQDRDFHSGPLISVQFLPLPSAVPNIPASRSELVLTE